MHLIDGVPRNRGVYPDDIRFPRSTEPGQQQMQDDIVPERDGPGLNGSPNAQWFDRQGWLETEVELKPEEPGDRPDAA
jgi:hypothetical protein